MLGAILFYYRAKAQTPYTVDQLLNPQVNGRTNVCDPDGLLPSDATDSLNNLAAEMKHNTGAELAIAVVRNFDQNQDDFGFATSLFRKWRIGGAHANNGLLLFIATDRKQYRFITGYGLEGTLPDALLSGVGRQYLVPAFREGAYGHGIIRTITVIDAYLRQPANQKDMRALLAKDREHLVTPWYEPIGIMALTILIYVLLSRHMKKHITALPQKPLKDGPDYENSIGIIVTGLFIICFAGVFILALTIGFSWVKRITLSDGASIVYGLLALAFALKYLNALSIIRKSHIDDINYNTAAYQFQKSVWWYVLFSPLVLLLIATEAFKRMRGRRRLMPQMDEEGHQLTRINRDENPTGDTYLTAGQKREEKEGVYSYDIWLGTTPEHYKVMANEGRNFGKFDTCPKCGFKTLAHPVVETVIAPTYAAKGEGKKVARCSFCPYVEMIKMVTMPVLTESSSSSSSGSGSGSSSSLGSGSFGGGSTGGGGAGGSW